MVGGGLDKILLPLFFKPKIYEKDISKNWNVFRH